MKVFQLVLQKYISIKYKVKFGSNCTINRKNVFEGKNALYSNTRFSNSFLGYGSYISKNSDIRFTKIGRYCAIGDFVRTYLGKHPSNNYVSIHPAFFSPNSQAGFTYVDKSLFPEHTFIQPGNEFVVEIGNDVWIGNNVIIMDGIKIADGAIIGAGSIVTKSVPAYSIVAGNPAKIIKYRFNEDQIDFLLKSRWWELEPEWLEENYKLFSSIDEFIKTLTNNDL